MNQYEQRINETKNKIYNAFIELAKTKPIHTISISQLCQMAHINRSTFYHYYGSQYDVLNELSNQFVSTIENQLLESDFRDQKSVQNKVSLCFEYAAQNCELALLLMRNNKDIDFASYLFSIPMIEELLNEKTSDMSSEKEKQASLSFVTHGAYQLLLEWLETPDRIPADEESKLVLKLARKIL
ncbi:MAG: TetR/AcrR family transcriptional regulator [Erysipelotrichaceae bacterium]|nr:TetR/AcrR family transcriptional regulator [Erysipelotrichaceae bacterium]